MRVLELFSGTHSIGKVCKSKGYEVISLDRDLGDNCPWTNYKSDKHIKEDIMTWDYKQYPKGHFKLITASPSCFYWSKLRDSWIGRKCKTIHPTEIITKEHILDDIERYGKPMVDKIFEIIEYFEPKYWWIENPQTGKMKTYITDQPFYDVDYCKYSDWGYQKRTRFWTNIEDFKPLICKKDCDNIITIKKTLENDEKKNKKIHSNNLSNGSYNLKKLAKKHIIDMNKIGGGNNRLERYRIPELLIIELLKKCE